MKKVYIVVLLIISWALSGCGSASTPTAIPTISLNGISNSANATPVPHGSQSSGQSVTASGTVITAQDVQLAFSLTGSVSQVHVTEGSQVHTGDILVELDNASIQMEVEQVQRTLRELTSQGAIAAAEQEVATAQKNYDDAKKKVDSINNRHADSVTINYLKDQVTLAQAALDRARDAYSETSGYSSVDPIRAKAATNLYNAQKAYNTAVGNLSWYADQPSANDVALAKANFDSAAAALQEAQWYLSELKGESIPANATGQELATLQQARDNLKSAQDRLAHTQLHASISGVVTLVNAVAGEYVVPGQTIVAISDVNNLKVITKDLSERDIPKVSVGENTSVLVEALNVEVPGHVESISSVADTLGGDVVYKTTVTLDSLPDGIRSGMSVTVNFMP